MKLITYQVHEKIKDKVWMQLNSQISKYLWDQGSTWVWEQTLYPICDQVFDQVRLKMNVEIRKTNEKIFL